MLRTIALVTSLMIATSMPTAAQQALSEQDARQIAQSVVETWNKAFAAKDAAGLAAQYTEDYIMFGPPRAHEAPDGMMSGRASMEQHWSGALKGYTPDPDRIVQVSPLGRDAVWVVLTWSGTANGPKGEHYSGTTARVYVRDGDNWKIRREMWNNAAPS